MGARIIGVGQAVPDRVVTNADFEAYLDTSDTWITERTGIRERRFGGTTSSLAIEAGRRAIADAGLTPGDIDFLVLSTTTPDQTVPATSAEVSHQLGTRGGAMDLNAACAGYVYALVVARGMIASGAHRVLVIGSDTLSRITDQNDRSTAVLFADGAGAVVMERADEDDLLGWDLGVDGAARPILYCDHGGYMYMEGREVFKRAVRVMVESSETAMKQAGVNADDIALLVPHQANLRIIQAANERLGISLDRTAVVLDRYGNTSSGSIPLALADAVAQGRLHPGDHVLFTGFGAGMTWASAVWRWAR
ncbi:3-oxoacyl-(acyl-carrier-protein) synthase III [Acidimicrobium ferrooxidans DSM 10331]|uniref:Beta-ketoacyl-[acyl-carrier-protein] synthase III n=1 Tax=Acidimicrobium ferrooxidans (strain DSM 10331 / JCM 15462 / NBRC 103882 / ICP) TaxID=525909 RepID=C7LZ61_ACIFD|nr:beta-ketoacyl-ACP synthase III [Acidimicrobium ferrooxidans]ACU54019.1 3-oxoacyl-(acyl-carrier-protein) synthase III [Acidimicrobium ferrooxidans DSM 10331]